MSNGKTIQCWTRWLAHSPLGPRYFDTLEDAKGVFPRCQIAECQAIYMAVNFTLNGFPKEVPLADVRKLLSLPDVRVRLQGEPYELVGRDTIAAAFSLNSKQADACRELGHRHGAIILQREQAVALLEPEEIARIDGRKSEENQPHEG